MSDRQRESALWKWLRKAREHWGPALHMHRVENALVRGTPDVEGCLIGDPFWAELKAIDSPRDYEIPFKVGLRKEQAAFLRARNLACGNAWMLVSVGKEGLYLVDGASARLFLEPRTLGFLEAYDRIPKTFVCISPGDLVKLMAASRGART